MVLAVRALRAQLGRDPISTELCAAAGCSISSLADLWNPHFRQRARPQRQRYQRALNRLRRLAGCAPLSGPGRPQQRTRPRTQRVAA